MTQPTKLTELIEGEKKAFENKFENAPSISGSITDSDECCNCGEYLRLELYEAFSKGYEMATNDSKQFLSASLHRVSSAMMKEMLADVVGEECNKCLVNAIGECEHNKARQKILARASKNWNITIGEGDK